jgi:ubiquinone/menaquinone biosynthesis C-methylase UbiE
VWKQPSAKNDDQRFDVLKDKIRKHLLKYTRKAFRMIPQINRPRILDIGCGSGIPTLELAKLSWGEVIGIDIDQPALDKFIRKIAEAGINKRVQALHCSKSGYPLCPLAHGAKITKTKRTSFSRHAFIPMLV